MGRKAVGWIIAGTNRLEDELLTGIESNENLPYILAGSIIEL